VDENLRLDIAVYIDIAGWVTVRANCKPYNPAGIVLGS
jgi:hypothetical protein